MASGSLNRRKSYYQRYLEDISQSQSQGEEEKKTQ
jgi:hypothetical protein